MWPIDLAQAGYAPTTIKCMLLNASAFMEHCRVFHLESAGLSERNIEMIKFQLRRLMRDNSRTLLGHQQAAKRRKSGLLRSSMDLNRFKRKAEAKVPVLLDAIQSRATATLYRQLQGYLAGYLAIITGHRPSVFCNMTKADLLQAEKDSLQRTVVWVGI